MNAKNLWMLGALMVAGCNGHPLSPLEESVIAGRQQLATLPNRAAVDFLFVIDDSTSMCEEQVNLAKNINHFADFFVGKRTALDFRIAVTTTDMVREDKGAFALAPVQGFPGCRRAGGVTVPEPETEHCQALVDSGELGPVLDADSITEACATHADPEACAREEMGRRFRCLAVRGTEGSTQEKGLAAMQHALDCAGPNRAFFGECCTETGYDPACRPSETPAFLRPEALLVVVIVADEDDCSDDAETPIDTAELSNCVWQREKLVPVMDYYRFLMSLKARPLEQVQLAVVVGDRLVTSEGEPLRYMEGVATAACDPGVLDQEGQAACCPDGVCTGEPRVACQSDFGKAFSGTRYLELADLFGDSGLGCAPGSEDSEACLSICAGDFGASIGHILGRVDDALSSFCLDALPQGEVEVVLDCAAPHCLAETGRRRLSRGEFEVTPSGNCAAGLAVVLEQRPPAGSRVEINYRVEMP